MVAQRTAPITQQRSAPPPRFNQIAQDYTVPLQSVVYDGGLRNPIPVWLMPDGYLERLTFVVTLNGTYGVAGPSAVDTLAQWSGPVERLEIVGTQNRGLYNLTGEFAGMFTFLDRFYRSAAASPANIASGPGFNGVALPGTVAFADVFNFDISLGVKMVESEAPFGLYPVGFLGPPPRLNVYWRPVSGTAANPGTGVYVPGGGATGPTPNGVADISQRGYAAIAIDSAQPPANLIRSYREGSQPINGNQVYEIQLTQGAFYGRIILLVIANGALAPYTNVSFLEYDYGFGMRRKQWNSAQLGSTMTQIWGSLLPTYMIVLDFYTATRSMRDWVNSVAVTRPRILITLAGLTYGGSQNQIRYGVEEFYPVGTAVAMSQR